MIFNIYLYIFTCIIYTLDIGFPNNRFFIRLIEKYWLRIVIISLFNCWNIVLKLIGVFCIVLYIILIINVCTIYLFFKKLYKIYNLQLKKKKKKKFFKN